MLSSRLTKEPLLEPYVSHSSTANACFSRAAVLFARMLGGGIQRRAKPPGPGGGGGGRDV
jgi:hypothetical protein